MTAAEIIALLTKTDNDERMREFIKAMGVNDLLKGVKIDKGVYTVTDTSDNEYTITDL